SKCAPSSYVIGSPNQPLPRTRRRSGRECCRVSLAGAFTCVEPYSSYAERAGAMTSSFRRDDYVQDALGNAISGANVYVTSQPTNTGHFNDDDIWVPPSPLVQLYSDPL